MPLSALRSARPVIGSPANYRRAVMLTYEQFRYSFANAISESEARRLYEAYPVPGSGIPLFQAATANINPFTEIKVDTKNPHRGPMCSLQARKTTSPRVPSPPPPTENRNATAMTPKSRRSRTAATPCSSTAAGKTLPKQPSRS